MTPSHLTAASAPDLADRRVGAAIHDFNNSLQAIVSVLNLLQCRISPGSIKDFDRLMEVAMTSTSKAHMQARELASGLRNRAAQATPVALDAFFSSLQPLLAAIAGDDVALEMRLKAGSAETICKRQDLENVLINLVRNARDAMPEGGTLLIETIAIARSGPENPGFVGLQVADTGSGMSPAAIEQACQAYYTTKGPVQGSGLGLWSVKDFTERHDGRLSIHSLEGEGTAVQILLPAT